MSEFIEYFEVRIFSVFILFSYSRGDGLCRFIVKKDAPGLQATKMENKIGLRMVQNGDILLKKVFVPDEDRLPGVNSFKDTNKVWCFYSAYTLNFIMVKWVIVLLWGSLYLGLIKLIGNGNMSCTCFIKRLVQCLMCY